MSPIQFILIILLIAIVVTYFGRLRSRLRDTVILILFGAIGIVMVAVPDLTTMLARLVGVGRGTDLLIYLGLVGFGFLILLLYSNQREMGSRLTDLVRAIAIEQARTPTKTEAERGSTLEEQGARRVNHEYYS